MEVPTAVNNLNQSHVSAYHKEMEKGKYCEYANAIGLFMQTVHTLNVCNTHYYCISIVCINVKVNWSSHSDLLFKSGGCWAVTFFLASRTSEN